MLAPVPRQCACRGHQAPSSRDLFCLCRRCTWSSGYTASALLSGFGLEATRYHQPQWRRLLLLVLLQLLQGATGRQCQSWSPTRSRALRHRVTCRTRRRCTCWLGRSLLACDTRLSGTRPCWRMPLRALLAQQQLARPAAAQLRYQLYGRPVLLVVVAASLHRRRHQALPAAAAAAAAAAPSMAAMTRLLGVRALASPTRGCCRGTHWT